MKKTTRILWMALAMLMLSVSCTKKSSEKQILSFRFMSPSVEAVIVEMANSIYVTVPSDTDVTNLTPIIVVSEKATVNPSSGMPMDFTRPVIYTVTAEDGSQVTYMVFVTVMSNESRILTFAFEDLEVEAVIDEDLKKVEATVPWETDVTTLVPTITISKKATISPASGVPTDFTDPVIYTVTAEDGSQTDYTAIVTIEAPVISDKPFVGIWGVEKIEYYNIDYSGNPILATLQTYEYTLGDSDDGIDLVFREDNTGELRDRSRDTIYDGNDIIICPDTTLVTGFTYSYDAQDATLYMNMEYAHTFRMNIIDLEIDSFVYENEYASNYVEKAYLKRLSYTPDKSTGKKNQHRPSKKGSLLGKK